MKTSTYKLSKNKKSRNDHTTSHGGDTHIALALGHVHGVLHVGRNDHLVVDGLALFLLKLCFVHFLQREGGAL